MVQHALKAAERRSENGIEIEVVDPRTLLPLDVATIACSIRRTNRARWLLMAVRSDVALARKSPKASSKLHGSVALA
jgi:pyruvate/2-oxoglutarate/acetoin dehydrogenase E1 component